MPHDLIALKLDKPSRSVTAKTAKKYLERAASLVRRFEREADDFGLGRELLDFVRWLIGLKSTLAPASWQQYKAAVLYTLRNNREVLEHTGSEDDVLAIAALEGESQTGTVRSTSKTSSCKAKRLPDGDHDELQRLLHRSRSRYAPLASALLLGGRLTGLRPDEWRGARLILYPRGSRVRLVVRNAKNSNGRAHGKTRTLDWARLPRDLVEAMRRCIVWAREADAADCTDADLKGAQALVCRLCRKRWPRRKRHYCLYSARHEFAAQAKLVYSPEEVAALMGHAVDTTATSHYGRIGKGGGLSSHARFPLPRPCPTEVNRVRRLLQASRFRLAAISAASQTRVSADQGGCFRI